jgi:hypothetical protein
MTPDEQADNLPETDLDLDSLSPDQARRFQLWRAMSDLSKAQADGRLSPEQARLLEALADSLQQLATQLNQLAALGQQYVQALNASTDSAGRSVD